MIEKFKKWLKEVETAAIEDKKKKARDANNGDDTDWKKQIWHSPDKNKAIKLKFALEGEKLEYRPRPFRKNDAGEWIISSAVVRPIFADFFKDLKKVRQSVPPKDLEGTHANRATRRVDGLSCLLTRAGFHILGLLVGRYITIACDCQLLNAVRPPHFVAVRCLGKHRLHPDHAPSRVRWT